MCQDNVPEYVKLYKDVLKIPTDFLERHQRIIIKRLTAAHGEIKKEAESLGQDVFYGIHQCFHLANSIILLGGNADSLDSAINYVQIGPLYQNLPQTIDATTLLSVAVLFYILKYQEERSCLGTIIRDIRERLDLMKWMIGDKAMQALGIEEV
jgi:hypothetical protein